MRLGRRLSTGIAEDPPVPAETEPAVALADPAPQHDAPTPARTPDPAVSGT